MVTCEASTVLESGSLLSPRRSWEFFVSVEGKELSRDA